VSFESEILSSLVKEVGRIRARLTNIEYQINQLASQIQRLSQDLDEDGELDRVVKRSDPPKNMMGWLA